MRVNRSKVVSARVTAEEYAALDALAGGQPESARGREGSCSPSVHDGPLRRR